MVIAIIGGGASGMAAAIAASEKKENKVIILEKNQRLGKKLLATGNGRCNLSNLNTAPEHYHGENPDFCHYALEKFPPKETLEWFRGLGLFSIGESSGKVYPYSDQANSVLDILRMTLRRSNIEIREEFDVIRARKSGKGFTIESKQEQLRCDRLIIACGGLAGTKFGGSLSGYKLLQSFGHQATRLRPALVQLKADWSGLKALKGVRANCRAAICLNGAEVIASEGELQFTDYGLSGPVIFEISRDACIQKGNWEAKLDLIPHISAKDLLSALLSRKATSLSTDDLLIGILHNRLGKIITKEAGIPFGKPIAEIESPKIERLCKLIKEFKIKLVEPLGMEHAQVTAGGINTKEFNDQTMESLLIKGLFACGEVLDIDGDCGGFNLQWAWSSGRLAGSSSIK